MRAAVFHAAGDIRLEDVDAPSPGPGEVAIAVAFNGLCGSDLHEYLHGPVFIPVEPHPLTGARLPVTLGHEFAGCVADVGPGVERLAIGDRVAVEPLYHCGRCRMCVTGAYNLCPSRAFHGLAAAGGGLSERTVVREEMVHHLPDSVTLERGALVEPMAVALHAVRRTSINAGDAAVILGAGPIGIGAFFALRRLGAAPIIVAEPSADRRATIQRLGADHVLDPGEADIVAKTRRLTEEGAAVVVDAAGVPATANDSLRLVRSAGHVVTVAAHAQPVQVNPNQMLREITWTGSLAYTAADFREVIELMDKGEYADDSWIHHVALSDLTAALDAMAAGTVDKVLVDIAPSLDSTRHPF